MDNRIHELPCFKDIVEISALSGGLTNQIFKVIDASGAYVVRFASDRDILGIDKTVELTCLQNAAALGVAPGITYSDENVIVTHFVEGETLTDDLAQRNDVLAAVVETLKHLHNPLHELHGRLYSVSPFRSITSHIAAIEQHKIEFDGNIQNYVAITKDLCAKLPPFTPTLCHADLVGGNIIFDGNKAWLIDWEYGGIGDPLFDLGWFSVANNLLSEEDCNSLLNLYYGKTNPDSFKNLRVMQTLCALRDALWAIVQKHGSTLDVDYSAHARKYFALHERLLSRI
jgi:thiamine kinase-like enzyme